MKKIFYSLMFGIAFMTMGCDHKDCPTCSDNWDSNTIYGSGNIISKEYNLPDFHSIVHNTVGDVKVTQGSEQTLMVMCDDNIQQFVRLEVKNGSLYISLKPENSFSNISLMIEATITDVRSFSANSAGSITGQNTFYADEIYLSSNSAGNINMNVQTKNLYTAINSAGNIFLKGSSDRHYTAVNSAGNLQAFGLITDTTSILATSAGYAQVNVSKYLVATISSIGSVFYIGHPEISANVSSLGQLVDAN